MVELIIEAGAWIGRVLSHLLAEFVIQVIFYWPGWLFLRLVTFGRYPPRRPIGHDFMWVAAVGVIVLAVGAALCFYLASFR